MLDVMRRVCSKRNHCGLYGHEGLPEKSLSRDVMCDQDRLKCLPVRHLHLPQKARFEEKLLQICFI